MGLYHFSAINSVCILNTWCSSQCYDTVGNTIWVSVFNVFSLLVNFTLPVCFPDQSTSKAFLCQHVELFKDHNKSSICMEVYKISLPFIANGKAPGCVTICRLSGFRLYVHKWLMCSRRESYMNLQINWFLLWPSCFLLENCWKMFVFLFVPQSWVSFIKSIHMHCISKTKLCVQFFKRFSGVFWFKIVYLATKGKLIKIITIMIIIMNYYDRHLFQIDKGWFDMYAPLALSVISLSTSLSFFLFVCTFRKRVNVFFDLLYQTKSTRDQIPVNIKWCTVCLLYFFKCT